MFGDFTPQSLYDYGRTAAAVKSCIPDGLVQSLPRITRLDGAVALEYWYYHVNAFVPVLELQPLFYLAIDPWFGFIRAFEAYTAQAKFRPSFLDMIFIDPENAREVKYLEHAAQLLNDAELTDEEITHAQALWLDAQCEDAFNWLLRDSGIRPEAVEELLRPSMDDPPRHLLTLWIRLLLLSLDEPGLKALVWQRMNAYRREDPAVLRRLENSVPAWGSRMEGQR